MRRAIVVNGVVGNVVLWDGVSEWEHGGDDAIDIDAPEFAPVSKGWIWDGTTFTAPPAPPEEDAS